MLDSALTFAVAGFCSFLAVAVSFYQIACHLRNYSEPVFQRYILRVIFMVPFYATASWFSLKYRHSSIWFDTVRDCYEAWVIYNFLSLCFAYAGGPGAIVVKLEGKIVHPSWLYLTCCLPPTPVDGFFLRSCKQGTLQFVILKPFLAALTLILYVNNLYHDSVWSPKEGYLYIAIIYNIAYTVALYALILFLIGCESALEAHHPVLKFVLVKGVVFLTFWQGMAISSFSGSFPEEADAKALQNFLLCLEMLIAAITMLFAFPHSVYRVGGSMVGFRWDAIVHAISIRDLFSDTVHQFGNTYKDYVLYSDGGPGIDPKRKHGKPRASSQAHAIANGKSEHPRASLVRNMEQGPSVAADTTKGSKNRKRKQPKLQRNGSVPPDRNTMQLVDSESDMSDDGGDEMQLGMEGDVESPTSSQRNLPRVASKRNRSRPPAPNPKDDRPASQPAARPPTGEQQTNGDHSHANGVSTSEIMPVDLQGLKQ